MWCPRILAQALLLAPPLCCLASCSGDAPAEVRPEPQATPLVAPAIKGPLVLFLGDSLCAGLHLAESQAFPALLQQAAIDDGRPFRLINAGISGDTTAGGLERLTWSLRAKPDLVVLELGANDGLRGIPLASIQANLLQIVQRIQESGAEVLLLGMRMPPNYGPEYTQGFEEIYRHVARQKGVPLVPFFLEGVAGDPSLNLPDGIHPTAAGHVLIAAHLKAQLWALLP